MAFQAGFVGHGRGVFCQLDARAVAELAAVAGPMAVDGPPTPGQGGDATLQGLAVQKSAATQTIHGGRCGGRRGQRNSPKSP